MNHRATCTHTYGTRLQAASIALTACARLPVCVCSELFAEIGPLKTCSLASKPDGSSKGFAHVTYKRKADAETALERYNNVPLDGKPLRITMQQNVAPAGAGAANVQVVAGGRGGGRVVSIVGRGRGKGKGGRGAFGAAMADDDEEETGFGGRGKGGRGKGKGGKGKGKGGGGRGGGKPAPKSMEDLDAELDAYKATAE